MNGRPSLSERRARNCGMLPLTVPAVGLTHEGRRRQWHLAGDGRLAAAPGNTLLGADTGRFLVHELT
eukprot:CAMPEP_0176081676 /NCGR_PEP_ID=MMETSP0120_2-20121206/40855_1 /TAXON_ID=160619 /ORGANISM="Kryptoperidinium foliaceum, Strain CCMP 1326" /LENGTH=66 /DNA_ID=CAMNT_0017415443 /DNA_START=48 /DNA_END=249 /DNA_ORIENTATION=-